MWVKCENGNYVDHTTGNYFDVKNRASSESDVADFAVRLGVSTANRGVPYVVHSGYVTAEDAQAALDEMMIGEDAVLIQPPVIPEEEATPVAVGKE